MSNSKVSSMFGVSKAKAKKDIGSFMDHNPNSCFYYNETNGVTALVFQEFEGSNVMRVSTSVMSPDENKFRVTLGKYIAMNSMLAGQYINLPFYAVADFIDYVVYS